MIQDTRITELQIYGCGGKAGAAWDMMDAQERADKLGIKCYDDQRIAAYVRIKAAILAEMPVLGEYDAEYCVEQIEDVLYDDVSAYNQIHEGEGSINDADVEAFVNDARKWGCKPLDLIDTCAGA